MAGIKDNPQWQEDERNGGAGMVDSQCNTCAHKWEGLKCDAFPSGIPLDVLTNRVKHDRPLPEFGQRNPLVYKFRGMSGESVEEYR